MTLQTIRNSAATLGVFSVLSLLFIFSEPAAVPGDAPKAFAHGAGFVLPCIVVAGLFAMVGTVMLLRMACCFSWKALKHPISIVCIVLFLPGLALFVPSAIFSVSLLVSLNHSQHFRVPQEPQH